MRKLLFISSLWVLVSGLVEAEPRKRTVQAPVIEWYKGYGTDGGDHVHHGMQTSDGGYIMVGQTEKDRNGSDMLVVKTDAKGNLTEIESRVECLVEENPHSAEVIKNICN